MITIFFLIRKAFNGFLYKLNLGFSPPRVESNRLSTAAIDTTNTNLVSMSPLTTSVDFFSFGISAVNSIDNIIYTIVHRDNATQAYTYLHSVRVSNGLNSLDFIDVGLYGEILALEFDNTRRLLIGLVSGSTINGIKPGLVLFYPTLTSGSFTMTYISSSGFSDFSDQTQFLVHGLSAFDAQNRIFYCVQGNAAAYTSSVIPLYRFIGIQLTTNTSATVSMNVSLSASILSSGITIVSLEHDNINGRLLGVASFSGTLRHLMFTLNQGAGTATITSIFTHSDTKAINSASYIDSSNRYAHVMLDTSTGTSTLRELLVNDILAPSLRSATNVVNATNNYLFLGIRNAVDCAGNIATGGNGSRIDICK